MLLCGCSVRSPRQQRIGFSCPCRSTDYRVLFCSVVRPTDLRWSNVSYIMISSQLCGRRRRRLMLCLAGCQEKTKIGSSGSLAGGNTTGKIRAPDRNNERTTKPPPHQQHADGHSRRERAQTEGQKCEEVAVVLYRDCPFCNALPLLYSVAKHLSRFWCLLLFPGILCFADEPRAPPTGTEKKLETRKIKKQTNKKQPLVSHRPGTVTRSVTARRLWLSTSRLEGI